MAQVPDDGPISLPPHTSDVSPSQRTLSPPVDPSGSALRLSIFRKVVASGCSIQSQQRGERELAETELCEVLDSILSKKPGSFLMRFGKCLNEDDLKYFDGRFGDNYEVNFRLKKLRKTLKQSSKTRMKAVKNRRYKYLKQMMDETSYFTEEEMQQRNPLLYEYYIGQFLSEEERYRTKENPTDMKLSSMILENLQVDRTMKLLEQQRKSEAEQLEELDTSSEEDGSDDEDASAPMRLSSNPDTLSKERALLSQEFLAVMQASFLNGQDRDFDYSKVDNNEMYDSLDLENNDAQDDYFDSEQPSWCAVDDSEAGMELDAESQCPAGKNEVGEFVTSHPIQEPSGNSLHGQDT